MFSAVAVAGVLGAVVCALAFRVWWLTEQLQKLAHEYRAFSAPLLWARWWARNAAESARIDERDALLRLALAALYADSTETLRTALRAREWSGRAPLMWTMALQELEAPLPAWEHWAILRPKEEPTHRPELVDRALIDALNGEFVPAERP
jgi:hypothetical protein